MENPTSHKRDDEETGPELLSATGWKKALGCKYAQLCRHCQASALVCNDDTEASAYCGTYDLFDNFRPDKMNMI